MMTKTIFNTMPLLGKVKTIRWMAPMLVFSVLLVMGCSSDDDSFTGGQGEQEMTDSTAIALTYHHFIAPTMSSFWMPIPRRFPLARP